MKVSVIVPIYNAEKCLEKCITSIMSQSYHRIQIVLVNDGSTDRSLDVCEQYEATDARICVVNQVNGGVVSARKAGVLAASGDYICWVDADDWVEEDFVKDFVEIQKQTQADVVAMSLYHDINDNTTIDNNGLADGEYSLEQVLPRLMYSGKFYEYGVGPHLVTKMFRSSIIRESELSVDERIVAGDDAAAVYPAMLRCGKIAIKNKANYHYVQHPTSITKVASANEEERVEILIDYLAAVYRASGVYDVMKKQVDVYRNYLLALRKIEYFDVAQEEVLVPYGGVRKRSKVIIYGAGVLGQMIYKYLKKDNKLDVVRWLDRNYKHYRTIGYEVDYPDVLDDFNEEYDYVLIANISEETHLAIRDFLIGKGIPSEKIKWFSEEFRCG